MDTETLKTSWDIAKPWIDRLAPLWAILGLLTLHHFIFITRLQRQFWPLIDATSLTQLSFSLLVPAFLAYIVFKFSYWYVLFVQNLVVGTIVSIVLRISSTPQFVSLAIRKSWSRARRLHTFYLLPIQLAWGATAFFIFSGAIAEGLIAPLVFSLGMLIVFPLLILAASSIVLLFTWKRQFNYVKIKSTSLFAQIFQRGSFIVLALAWAFLTQKMVANLIFLETNLPLRSPYLVLVANFVASLILAGFPLALLIGVPELPNLKSTEKSIILNRNYIFASALTLFVVNFSWYNLLGRFENRADIIFDGETTEISIILPTSKGLIIFNHSADQFGFISDDNLFLSVSSSNTY